MDPKQTPPQVGVNSGSMGDSATGRSVFANAPNRFRDTTPKGDIIIPPSTPAGSNGRSSKKPIIIAVIVALIVIIAIVILAVVNKGGSPAKNSASSSSEEASIDESAVAEAFNKYANFIISGEASTERMPSEDELDDATINSKVANRDVDFINEAKTYFDAFYDKLTDLDDVTTALLDWSTNYKQTLDFLVEYVKFSPTTTKKLSSLAAKEGVSAAEAEIDKLYKPFLELDSSDAVEYARNMIAYHKALLNNQASEATTYQQQANDVLFRVYERIVDGCYNIDTLLFETDGEDIEDEEPENSEEEEEEE